MGKNIEVILLEDLSRTSGIGETKKVALGYARNFLLPQGKAVLPTPENKALIIKLQKKASEKRERQKKQAEELKVKLDQKVINFKVKTNKEGHLYGAVTEKEIIAEIKKQLKVELEKGDCLIKPIKELGKCNVPIEISKEVSITVIAIVEDEEAEVKMKQEKERKRKEQEAKEKEEKEKIVEEDIKSEEESEEGQNADEKQPIDVSSASSE